MTFMEEVAVTADNIWKECSEVEFLTEMVNGTLSKQRFLDYMIQNSLYLRDYIKAHAMALYKSRSLKEMKAFYSVLAYVNDSENATRLKYLMDYNLTDEDIDSFEKHPACENYTKYLIDYSVNEDIPEILMAFMPCMLGYYEVFKIIIDQYPQVTNSYYKDFIADYTSDEYKKSCDYWIKFTNEICEPLEEKRKEKLKSIYIESSMHELAFWQM